MATSVVAPGGMSPSHNKLEVQSELHLLLYVYFCGSLNLPTSRGSCGRGDEKVF